MAVVGRQKHIIFPLVGVMLAFNYWLVIVRPRRMDCAPGDVCHIDSPTSRFNRIVLWTSVSIYVIAVTLTYGSEWWLRWSA
jgi:hypothetical protein